MNTGQRFVDVRSYCSFSPARLRAAFAILAAAAASGFAAPRLHAQEPQSGDNAAEKLPGTIYVRSAFQQTDEAGNRKNFDGICAVDPNSGEVNELLPACRGVRVSPDGKHFAVCVSVPATADRTASSEIRIIDATTFETEHVIEGGDGLCWSGNGRKLIYNVSKPGDDGGWRVKASVFDLATKETRVLPTPATDNVDDCSADGQWLLTTSDRHPPRRANYQIYIMHPDGSAQRPLTDAAGANGWARFRPDAKKIVYQRRGGGVESLWVVDVDGQNRRELLKSDEGRGSIDSALLVARWKVAGGDSLRLDSTRRQSSRPRTVLAASLGAHRGRRPVAGRVGSGRRR